MRATASRLSIAAAALLVCSLAAAPRAQEPPARRYLAKPAQSFELLGEDALFMPTAVTVGADGTVFVVDGVNDRIVQFNPDGTLHATISTVGDERLNRPVGAKADAAGRLWIADTGNRRVVVRSADGGLERIIVIPADATEAPPDITDAALSPDGGTLWLADNDHHRLLRHDIDAGATEVIGKSGESLGEFRYPFMLCVTPAGDVCVTDVLNGRVQIFNAAGAPVGSVATYGVSLGQLYRPKGVALDAEGNIWVADGSLDVIQVFTPVGQLLGVLGSADGETFRPEGPMGLAFDADGCLYVVELRANRVRKLRITKTTAPPPTVTPRHGSARVGQQGRLCTVCHMEWIEPLVNHRPTALTEVPPNPPDYPYVSRGEVCLGCHDGSVGDSRRRVWVGHGHHVDIEPPSSITVPDHLPLADGRIACRTCHSAHGMSEPQASIKETIFLRVGSSPGELCVQCHADHAAGPQGGSHPLGKMAEPIPQRLLDAGALVGPDRHVLGCLACHEGHGSQSDLMLVADQGHNELCLACHEQMRPGMFRAGERPPHPVEPKLTAEQAAAVEDVGAMLGEDGELICLSCHKMHNARSNDYILAFENADSDVCLRCHDDKNIVSGTSHDLRTNHPDETNIHGTTVTDGGPCSACHLFHNYARPVEEYPIDPRGQCVTCHQADRCAASKVLGSANHPGAVCSACHDPHDPQHGHYLAAPAAQLCVGCHEQQAHTMRGPHDVVNATDKQGWPKASVDADDTCLACHRPHGTEQTGLFRTALGSSPTGVDDVCLACHADTAPGAKSGIALAHARVLEKPPAQDLLPLVDTPDGKHHVACTTCHEPHQSPGIAPHLLRGKGTSAAERICLTCHPQLASIHTIGEAKESLQAAGFTATACKPCHVVHANPDEVESRYLWPKQLSDYERPAGEVSVTDDYCVTCHRTGGPVAPPPIASHPDVLMFNPTQPDAPGFFPLFDGDGQVSPSGTIACRTCHLTHGREVPATVPAEIGDVAGRELRARKWHIRTFRPASVCTTCHGVDALRRFMYYHDPQRRGGPIEDGGSASVP